MKFQTLRQKTLFIWKRLQSLTNTIRRMFILLTTGARSVQFERLLLKLRPTTEH